MTLRLIYQDGSPKADISRCQPLSSPVRGRNMGVVWALKLARKLPLISPSPEFQVSTGWVRVSRFVQQRDWSSEGRRC